MGFNTNITICNDNLGDYERNPEHFSKIICAGALNLEGTQQWGITVLPTEHADTTQLIAAGGNYATKIYSAHFLPSHHTHDGQIALLHQWATALGYQLTPTP